MIISRRDSRGHFSRLCARGFTLIEVVIAAGVIAVFVAGAVVAMTQLNRFATASRLQTLAQALAQQRIDEILTVRPWRGTSRPALLDVGTQTENGLSLNNDLLNEAAPFRSAFTGLDATVLATRTTLITQISVRQVRAEVAVTFTYRSRPYAIRMSTIRTQDTI